MKKQFFTVLELKLIINKKQKESAFLKGGFGYCGVLGYVLGYGGIIYK